VSLVLFPAVLYFVWFDYSDEFVNRPFTAWSDWSDALSAMGLGHFLFRLSSRVSDVKYYMPQLSNLIYIAVSVVMLLYSLVRDEDTSNSYHA
jgi:hypothetical protein